jgi:neutral ceramidase
MVVGMAKGRHGYLPTPEHHKLGGYETWLGTCYVEEQASVILTKNMLELAEELRSGD